MILLGEISVSLYLVHSTVFEFYLRDWQIDHSATDYFGLVVCVAATVVLAFMIWAVIEVPCRTAAKQCLRKRPAFLSTPSVSKEQA